MLQLHVMELVFLVLLGLGFLRGISARYSFKAVKLSIVIPYMPCFLEKLIFSGLSSHFFALVCTHGSMRAHGYW